MNALERNVVNRILDYTKENGNFPKYLECTIRWNDGDYEKSTIISTIPYNETDKDNRDDKIFFYLYSLNSLYEILANIDFTREDFDCEDDFFKEIDKYDTDDSDSPDWSYLHRGEDFCIVDITDMFSDMFD